MCDTLIALPAATIYSAGLFAKNSDRPPNEAQILDWIPAGSHSTDHPLRCTFLDIPQVSHTHGVLLSRPFWMWGAEMGINQHGLAIGNESVFSKIPANKEPALLGMDLLRLGLERARTASEAVDVITSLLEEFGQGGNCVQDGHLYYHNSFLIADPRESWVLETVDRHWAAKQVAPLYSISNLMTLERSWDLASSGLEDYMIEKGLAKPGAEIDLTAGFSDLIYSTFAAGKSRCARTREMMIRNQGEISIQIMTSILRDHKNNEDPRSGIANPDICAHATLGPIRQSQTTGSLIALLEADNPLIFATGTAAPCTGIFKPFWVDAFPDLGKDPTGIYDPETLWWSHERLHREVNRNFPARLATFRDERDALEEEFIQGAFAMRGAERAEREAYSQACLRKAAAAEARWLEGVLKIPPKPIWTHEIAWNAYNRKAEWAAE